ncbi:ATP-binding protein [Rubripirellula reticaptiva]|uniref:Orc1-like AAA ATPase domain-containing protein n=1 Tax=Rubripirellula reticaptiva TaxID=2528013 RepID=A0A5C6F1F2_9BACT|nr:AAA family ATPase [Rubripirellula reticaptiva]TWU55082.1 hypothetical protein Poly59_13770 [Rubripirellula reticaptiva]
MISTVADAAVSNPFCTRFVRPGAIPYRFSIGDERAQLDAIVDRLGQSRCGLIVGPHGTGKSTLVAEVVRRFESERVAVAPLQLCVSPSMTFLSRIRYRYTAARRVRQAQVSLASGGLLVVDGAEQLSRWAWCGLLRSARRRNQIMLATSHHDFPGATTLHRTGNSRSLIQELTESLIADSSDEIADRVSAELSRRQLSKSTNVRDLWFDLYDVVQS